MKKRLFGIVVSLSLLLGLTGPALAYDAGSVNQATTLSWGGSRYYAAVDTQGNLWMWGDNMYGELGFRGGNLDRDGKGLYYQNVPVKVLEDVVSVSCGHQERRLSVGLGLQRGRGAGSHQHQ